MARPCKRRRVCGKPLCNQFAPKSIENKVSIVLTLDEYECIRLIDYEGLEQEQCSKQMGVSRATIQAIYKSAREKIADMVINAKELSINGGDITFCERENSCNRKHCFAGEVKSILSKGGKIDMRIAVTYDNGAIFQHFGHTETFKVYDVEDGKVIASEVVDTNGSGHGALAGVLSALNADVLICGGIGGGAQMALAAAGIKLYGGVSGDADAAVAAFVAGNLEFNPNVQCSHHGNHHHGDHGCGSHGCGSHNCGNH